ncbi:hypothetical protein FCH28_27705 [Streptomyces piniterrae]|uniref:Uncharacterized protein n=1 Tax=Streptomyces piniterrae TaxID=2571125 RepID=A0A4V5MKC8_9ACTN|nr:hypothetical protein [Streptomyces piniterrae]TJZ45158.1 hypothetical protein FCH28_27705 [Streptomyces piniterrae]
MRRIHGRDGGGTGVARRPAHLREECIVDEGWYRLLSVLTAFAGIWEGPLAITYRLVSGDDGTPLRAANYLPGPWCYLVAVAAALVAFAVLAVLDNGRKKALARQAETTADAR